MNQLKAEISEKSESILILQEENKTLSEKIEQLISATTRKGGSIREITEQYEAQLADRENQNRHLKEQVHFLESALTERDAVLELKTSENERLTSLLQSREMRQKSSESFAKLGAEQLAKDSAEFVALRAQLTLKTEETNTLEKEVKGTKALLDRCTMKLKELRRVRDFFPTAFLSEPDVDFVDASYPSIVSLTNQIVGRLELSSALHQFYSKVKALPSLTGTSSRISATAAMEDAFQESASWDRGLSVGEIRRNASSVGTFIDSLMLRSSSSTPVVSLSQGHSDHTLCSECSEETITEGLRGSGKDKFPSNAMRRGSEDVVGATSESVGAPKIVTAQRREPRPISRNSSSSVPSAATYSYAPRADHALSKKNTFSDIHTGSPQVRHTVSHRVSS